MSMYAAMIERDSHPVDAVEQVADFHKWLFIRQAQDEISVIVQGVWTDYSVEFSWMEDVQALHISSAFDMRVPAKRADEVMRLVSIINEQMVLGHFDVWMKDGSVLFRQALPLNGGAELNEAQIQSLLDNAMSACERHYQAFQFVVWAGKSAQEALSGVLFDTIGEA